MSKVLLKISGMHCSSCSLIVDDTLETLKGVQKSDTNFVQGIVQVEFDESTISIEILEQSITCLGYKVEATNTV